MVYIYNRQWLWRNFLMASGRNDGVTGYIGPMLMGQGYIYIYIYIYIGSKAKVQGISNEGLSPRTGSRARVLGKAPSSHSGNLYIGPSGPYKALRELLMYHQVFTQESCFCGWIVVASTAHCCRCWTAL